MNEWNIAVFFIDMMFASYLNTEREWIWMKIKYEWMNNGCELIIEWMEEWRNNEWIKWVYFSVVLPDVFDNKIRPKTVSHDDWGYLAGKLVLFVKSVQRLSVMVTEAVLAAKHILLVKISPKTVSHDDWGYTAKHVLFVLISPKTVSHHDWGCIDRQTYSVWYCF